MQDKKPDVPASDDSNLVIVATPEYVKEAIAEHAASRNHPNATLQDKGFVVLSNDTGSDSETMAATPKAVKVAYDLANIANQHASNANNNANSRLAKELNGADIPDKDAFTENLGLGDVLRSGVYGIGSVNGGAIPNSDYNKAIINGVYAGPGEYSKNGIGNSRYGPCLVLSRNDTGIYQQANYRDEFYYRYRENGQWDDWHKVITSADTFVDNRDHIKKISPIILIHPTGTFATNKASNGATVERQSKGIYLIKNVLGFNVDGAVDSIETPRCQNDLPLLWVNHEVLSDGSIKLMTYHREHSDAPAFARNIRKGYVDGDLIDIPDGRFVSVRVQMPDTK
ncbi:phage tail fiber protein [Xenorhabdus stockiae]|uniref:phage tail fiber protein n=1 Tax=Xenorhabdus stockiae TaxID=351614 RepID=UPI004063B536